jgi:hypothetical protein
MPSSVTLLSASNMAKEWWARAELAHMATAMPARPSDFNVMGVSSAFDSFADSHSKSRLWGSFS